MILFLSPWAKSVLGLLLINIYDINPRLLKLNYHFFYRIKKEVGDIAVSKIQNLQSKIDMRLPKLSPPVKRPDIIYPHRSVDVIHGRVEDLVHIRMDLLHGANYNDPAAFQNRSYQQIKSSCRCMF